MAATMTRPPPTNFRCLVIGVDFLWKTSRDSMASSGLLPSSGAARAGQALRAASEAAPVGAEGDRGQAIGREDIAPVIRHGTPRAGRSRPDVRGSRGKGG